MHLVMDRYACVSQPRVKIKALGIDYRWYTTHGKNMWVFWDCKNVPDVLPDYIKELSADKEAKYRKKLENSSWYYD